MQCERVNAVKTAQAMTTEERQDELLLISWAESDSWPKTRGGGHAWDFWLSRTKVGWFRRSTIYDPTSFFGQNNQGNLQFLNAVSARHRRNFSYYPTPDCLKNFFTLLNINDADTESVDLLSNIHTEPESVDLLESKSILESEDLLSNKSENTVIHEPISTELECKLQH